MKSLNRRITNIEQSFPEDTKEPVTDINFIIPGEPVQQFGKTFETLEDCVAYCDLNNIPYTKQKGPFEMDSYNFLTD